MRASFEQIIHYFMGFDLHAFTNGFILGSSETGKTLCMASYAHSYVKPNGRLKSKLVVHDAHAEWASILRGLSVRQSDIIVSNPFSAMAEASWSVAHDYEHVGQARTLAQSLIPDEHESKSQPYFSNAARSVTEAVIAALMINAPRRWELYDLLFILSRPHLCVWVLGHVPGLVDVVAQHLYEPRQAAGVFGSIQASVSLLMPVAAVMRRARTRYSLRQWCKSDELRQAFLLSSDAEMYAPVNRLNAIMLETITRAFLSREKASVGEVRAAFLIDELPVLGKVPSVPRALKENRKVGCRTVFCSQSLEVLAEMYGQNLALDMLNQCSARGFTMPITVGAAEYLNRIAGVVKMPETSYGESWGSSGNGYSMNTGNTIHQHFLTSELSNLGRPSPRRGIPAATVIDGIPWSGFIDPRWLSKHLGSRPDDIEALALSRKPAEWALPVELTEHDWARLGFDGAQAPRAPLGELYGVALGEQADEERTELF